jgi:hypothetical protein
MKSTALLLAVSLLAAGAPARGDDAAFLAQFEKTFETGGQIEAAKFVPAELMKGTLHLVRPMAENDGLVNTYFVDTAEGVIEVTGTAALGVRIHELYAIEYLRGLSKSEAFRNALVKSGKAKVESVAGVVRNPATTIRNVPKGASRFFGRIGEGLKGGGSEGEDNALKGLTGVTAAKAKIAGKLGVSPYSQNQALQHELDAMARAMAGGGLVVDLATSAVGGPALTALEWNKTLQDTLTSTTAEDLRTSNRQQLLALGVDRALTEEFLAHPWYSPWEETVTTQALAGIGVNPSAFLADAVRALTEEDALFFQRVAQILAQYHAHAVPLRAIRFDGGIVTALDRDGTLVVPVSLDYGIWAERAARRVEQFSALNGHDGIKTLALWTDGRLSERLREELKTRAITFRSDALTKP